MSTLSSLSNRTKVEFLRHVPGATMRYSVATLPMGSIVVKRCESLLNQVHVMWGLPMVAHVPGVCWYVLPLDWLLAYAAAHPMTAAQHANDAFQCMFIERKALEPKHRVKTKFLRQKVQEAVAAAGCDTEFLAELAAADKKHTARRVKRVQNFLNL